MMRALAARLFVVLVLAPAALAQFEVVPSIRLIRGNYVPGTQPDGNTIVLDAPDGLVVVDTGRHTAHTQKILDYAKSSGRPIVAVVNTHWHLDHIGGNAAIRAAYPNVRVYASNALEGALTGFLSNYRKQLQELVQSAKDPAKKEAFEAEVKLIESGAKLAPDVVVSSAGPRVLGGRGFQMGLEKNTVTAGDVWLLDETNGVLIAGDLITLPAPFLDTACPARWKSALDRFALMRFDIVIPGHGAPLTRRQFDVYRGAFSNLLDCAAGQSAKEACIDQWVKAIAPLTADDEKFTRSLMDYYAGLLRSKMPESLKNECVSNPE